MGSTTTDVNEELRRLVQQSSSQGTSADVAYSVLRSAINGGLLGPGERLFANDLAEVMGFSRTPVREALRKLEAQDLIQLHPRGGLVVREMSEQELLEIYAIREALEGTAARFAAENMSPRDLTEIRNLVNEMAVALEKSDVERFRTLVLAVHRTLARASRNNRLLKLIDELQEVIIRTGVSTLRVPGKAADALKVHQQLVEALEKRDGPLAEDIVRKYRRSTFETRLAQYHESQIASGNAYGLNRNQ
ncbi:MAG: GntR family transcriptional regulator [Rhizobiaceae bacterium]|nr:GntR family transcriptional regulator [Rhizobiaceae bacterium]